MWRSVILGGASWAESWASSGSGSGRPSGAGGRGLKVCVREGPLGRHHPADPTAQDPEEGCRDPAAAGGPGPVAPDVRHKPRHHRVPHHRPRRPAPMGKKGKKGFGEPLGVPVFGEPEQHWKPWGNILIFKLPATMSSVYFGAMILRRVEPPRNRSRGGSGASGWGEAGLPGWGRLQEPCWATMSATRLDVQNRGRPCPLPGRTGLSIPNYSWTTKGGLNSNPPNGWQRKIARGRFMGPLC